MHLFIEASDVWLFRDGKPFTAGDDHRASSRFPPSPTTIQGAIRSKVLLESGVSLAAYARKDAALQWVADQIGWPGEAPPFRLHGPVLARRQGDRVERLYPAPADLLLTKKSNRFIPLKPTAGLPVQSDLDDEYPTLHLLWANTNKEDGSLKKLEGWLTEQEFADYLKDPETLGARWAGRINEPCGTPIPEQLLFVRESRVGIALAEGVRRPTEGMFFEVEYIRPRAGVGVVVEIGSVVGGATPLIANSFHGKGSFTLGGEGRLARWEVVSKESPDIPMIPAAAAHFKVVLLTPAIFEKGWRTNWKDIFSGPVELRAAAVGSPSVISGWDMATGRTKPARPTVPAGSVYFFEKEPGVTVTVRNDAFTDEDAPLDFGQFAIGAWHV